MPGYKASGVYDAITLLSSTGQSSLISKHTNLAAMADWVGAAVAPPVLGARVDGGLDSRLRGNAGL